MIQGRRPRLWLAVALAVVLVAAVALWLYGTRRDGSGQSALPTPISGVSPLPTPTPVAAATHLPSWAAGGAVLLWVTLGIVLALSIAVVILRHYRHDAA